MHPPLLVVCLLAIHPCIYNILCIFIAEVSLAATSSTTVVDLPSEPTHSMTKVSIAHTYLEPTSVSMPR